MNRKTLALFGVYALVAGVLACSSANPATPVAPTATDAKAAADGSTLKANAPTAQSPANGLKLTGPNVVLSADPATPAFASGVALQYRFQVMTTAGVIVDQALVNDTTWQVAATLLPNTIYNWRARAEYQGEAGPWSTTSSFITEDPAIINDPLTGGTTVGSRIGGRFLPGQGWQSLSLTDGIDYDLPTPCSDCRLEFDVTNFGKGEGNSVSKDLKWITMGDAGAFGDFSSFRDHDWKMHLEQRADGNGTGMKLIWRNGGVGGGNPGDHTGKVDPAVDWQSNQVFHFQLDWSPGGFSVFVNGERWFEDGLGGRAYAPGRHRISLGCYPRSESFVGIIYRNVKLTKH
jgi:hypothetical protein